jgi:hypothetical protein
MITGTAVVETTAGVGADSGPGSTGKPVSSLAAGRGMSPFRPLRAHGMGSLKAGPPALPLPFRSSFT